jgi:hypothetical protein
LVYKAIGPGPGPGLGLGLGLGLGRHLVVFLPHSVAERRVAPPVGAVDVDGGVRAEQLHLVRVRVGVRVGVRVRVRVEVRVRVRVRVKLRIRVRVSSHTTERLPTLHARCRHVRLS